MWMLLNILSTRKNLKFTNKNYNLIKFICIASMLFIQIFSENLHLYAEHNGNTPMVIIDVLSQNKTSLNKITAKVEVDFLDLSYYNDHIYLSYHVYGKTSGEAEELLVFENARYHVILDDSNKCYFEIEILLDSEKYKEQWIKFDIVDETNAYWFSLTSPSILSSENIVYSNNVLYSLVEPVIVSIIEHPIIFSLNIICFILFIILIIFAANTKLISFDVKNKKNT